MLEGIGNLGVLSEEATAIARKIIARGKKQARQAPGVRFAKLSPRDEKRIKYAQNLMTFNPKRRPPPASNGSPKEEISADLVKEMKLLDAKYNKAFNDRVEKMPEVDNEEYYKYSKESEELYKDLSKFFNGSEEENNTFYFQCQSRMRASFSLGLQIFIENYMKLNEEIEGNPLLKNFTYHGSIGTKTVFTEDKVTEQGEVIEEGKLVEKLYRPSIYSLESFLCAWEDMKDIDGDNFKDVKEDFRAIARRHEIDLDEKSKSHGFGRS